MSRAGDIAKRDGGWFCHYCLRELTKWVATLDHVVPRAKGGTTTFWNLVLACQSCNGRKGDKDYEEYTGRVFAIVVKMCCEHNPKAHVQKSDGGGCRVCDCKNWYR